MNPEINYYNQRIQNLIQRMVPNSLLVLFSASEKIRNHDAHYPYRNFSDLLYLTGINQENIILLISSNGLCRVFAEKRTLDQNRWEGYRLTATDIANRLGYTSKDSYADIKDFWNQLEMLMKDTSSIYIDFKSENEYVTKIFNSIGKVSNRSKTIFPENIINSSSLLHEMRLFKDPLEISLLQKACDISAKSHTNLMKYTRSRIKNGMIYEYELKAFLESEFIRRSGGQLAYSSIVASGNNATVLHYIECNTVVQENDLLLVDAGCEYQGYASDITRTYPINGKFTPIQKELYEVVLKAQLASIEKAYPNSTLTDVHKATINILVDALWDFGLLKKCIREVDKKGRRVFFTPSSREEVLEKHYYRDYYMHGTSHYLGLDVHDVGRYYINSKERLLEKNMVFTVEPGLYIPLDYEHIPTEFRGIGIRIEDDILITEDGHKVLTEIAPKTVDEIESLETLFS